jgi:hypothetical protein
MPNVICSELGCGSIMSDPCEQTHVLFLTKLRLTTNNVRTGRNFRYTQQLNEVNKALDSDKFKLIDHEQQFQIFVNERFETPSPTQAQTIRVFILECSNGHRKQYTLTCS